jgi:hypothetical protein
VTSCPRSGIMTRRKRTDPAESARSWCSLRWTHTLWGRGHHALHATAANPGWASPLYRAPRSVLHLRPQVRRPRRPPSAAPTSPSSTAGCCCRTAAWSSCLRTLPRSGCTTQAHPLLAANPHIRYRRPCRPCGMWHCCPTTTSTELCCPSTTRSYSRSKCHHHESSYVVLSVH